MSETHEVPNGWNPERHAEVAERVKRWDAGETVWTLDMGGMGPGYEQAIQLLVVEMCRDALAEVLPNSDTPKEERQTWGDKAISRTDESVGGYTGAMVGAARWLAYQLCAKGWDDLKARAAKNGDENREIQASKDFPRYEVAP